MSCYVRVRRGKVCWPAMTGMWGDTHSIWQPISHPPPPHPPTHPLTTHTHTHTHSLSLSHTHTHTQSSLSHTHTRAHTHTHAHTHRAVGDSDTSYMYIRYTSYREWVGLTTKAPASRIYIYIYMYMHRVVTPSTFSLFLWCGIKNTTKPQTPFNLLTCTTLLYCSKELWHICN